jgi:hypothetical protein
MIQYATADPSGKNSSVGMVWVSVVCQSLRVAHVFRVDSGLANHWWFFPHERDPTAKMQINTTPPPEWITLTWWGGLLHQRLETKKSQNAPTWTPQLDHPNPKLKTIW